MEPQQSHPHHHRPHHQQSPPTPQDTMASQNGHSSNNTFSDSSSADSPAPQQQNSPTGSQNLNHENEHSQPEPVQRTTSGQKSVCFHSITGQPGASRKVTNAIDCLQSMIEGSTMIKIKASLRQYRRYFSLEEDLASIRWTPSSKKSSKAKLPIKCIREVRPGKNTELLKSPDLIDTYSEDCSFSIMVGEDFESIDLIAASSEEANVWITGLNFLIGLTKSPDSFEGREKMREKWLVQVFDQADSDQTGTLDELETISLMKRLNSPLCIESLRQKIAEIELEKKNGSSTTNISSSSLVGGCSPSLGASSIVGSGLLNSNIGCGNDGNSVHGTCSTPTPDISCGGSGPVLGGTSSNSTTSSGISKNAFISLFNQTATRPDIYFILVRYCGRDYMSAEEFQLFLEGEQAIGGTSLEMCREIIERFEPSIEARDRKQFLIDGFSQFLLSDSCDILNSNSIKQIDEDGMNLPFAHYFIASSFNTYLTEDQVKGPSSCEGYERALLSGCRLVKIDAHDGPDGRPLVYHGNTLTGKICAESVLETIQQSAFVASPYPVIVLLENHCSVAQQRVLARLIQSIIGDTLFIPQLGANSDVHEPISTPTPTPRSQRLDSVTSNERVQSRTSPSVSSTSSDDTDPHNRNQQADGAHSQASKQPMTPVNHGGVDCQEGANNNNNNKRNHRQQLPPFQCSSTQSSANTHQRSQHQQLDALWNSLTPASLKHRIILSARKLARTDVDVDEITDDEDDAGSGNSSSSNSGSVGLSGGGGCSNGGSGSSGNGHSAHHHHQNSNGRKRTLLCQELSSLVGLPLRRTPWNADPQNVVAGRSGGELLLLSESSGVKTVHSSSMQCSDEFVSKNRTHLTLVTPNISRIDSSNMNPLDFFNTGVQFIGMNYQTNGQIMDIYRGWFTQNGACGFVPKPQFQRERYSFFNPKRKDISPGIEQMNVRVKIISGQQLPRPRGASLKASSIDPYVTVQCLGVPMDCAEARTRTVSNNGHNPIFDESFDFSVTVPELALVRFLVLDDDFINDDFIGQLTMPVSCLQPGYKHVHLLDLNGEPLENSSLFVKISLTTRASSKQKLRRKRSWSQKHHYETKQVGVRAIDEQLKAAFNFVHEIVTLRKGVEKYFLDLCDECSLHESANLVQCLRIITIRLASCASVISYKVSNTEHGYPTIQVSGELNSKLTRMTAALDKALYELNRAKQLLPELRHNLYEIYRQFSRSNFEQQISMKENSNILSHLLDNLRSTSPKYFKDSPQFEHSTPSNRSGYTSCDEDFSSTDVAHIQTPNSGKIGLKFNFSTSSGSSTSSQVNDATTKASMERTVSGDRFQRAGSSSNSPMGSFRSGSRRTEKITENLYWNLSVIKTELDNGAELENNCKTAFQQMTRIAESLEKVFEREHKVTLRSNSCIVRELSNVSNSMSNQCPNSSSLAAPCDTGHVLNNGANSSGCGSTYSPIPFDGCRPPIPLSPVPGSGHGEPTGLRGILKKTSVTSSSNGGRFDYNSSGQRTTT